MQMRIRFTCGTVLSLLLLTSITAVAEENWLGFRGPSGMGLTAEQGLPKSWGGPASENVLWKAPLPVTAAKGKPDHNQSSPIIVGKKVIVTTSFWPSDQAANEYPEHHVTCYNLDNGEQLWDTQVKPGPWKLSDLRGGYTAPTPVSDGQRLVVLFGSAVLAGLDLEGHEVWRVELANFTSFDVALAVSPIIYQRQLLLLGDRSNKKSTLTAFSLADGKVLWEVQRPEVGFAHSTPVVAEIYGQTQLLIAASNALQGVDPLTGNVLWYCKTPGDVASPIAHQGLVYIDSGRGGSGIAVDPPEDSTANIPVEVQPTGIKWTVNGLSEGLASPVVFGNQLYRSQNQGVLKCFDWTTGKELFAKRLEGLSSPSSPIVTPEGLIYFASAGKSYVLRAGPQYDLVSANNLGDPCSASPAVGPGTLILKGQQYLYCIGLKR